MTWHNEERLYSALDYAPPAEYECRQTHRCRWKDLRSVSGGGLRGHEGAPGDRSDLSSTLAEDNHHVQHFFLLVSSTRCDGWLMELRHLEYFLAVAEELNFTRAAERLHVGQSGVSASVRALENDLDTRLFERTSKQVSLTEAGAALLPQARRAVEAAQAARDAVTQTQGGLHGSLIIGTMSASTLIDLPGLFAEYHAAHPGVRLQLQVASRGSAGLVAGLLDGSLDAALVALASPPPGLTLRWLANSRLVVLLPADHPLASRREADPRDLAGDPFIDSPVGHGNRTVVDERMAEAGIHRQVIIEVADIITASAYVRRGLGVAIVPGFAAPADDPGLRVLRLAGRPLFWELSLATASHGTPNPALRALLPVVDGSVCRRHRLLSQDAADAGRYGGLPLIGGHADAGSA
jgi:DNA-binding transcriptional LysR family regulator